MTPKQLQTQYRTAGYWERPVLILAALFKARIYTTFHWSCHIGKATDTIYETDANGRDTGAAVSTTTWVGVKRGREIVRTYYGEAPDSV